jgi:YVTN family beta-propeller protein
MSLARSSLRRQFAGTRSRPEVYTMNAPSVSHAIPSIAPRGALLSCIRMVAVGGLLLPSGCATAPAAAGAHPVGDPAQRFELEGFSVLPPSGPAWFVLSPTSSPAGVQYSALALEKRPGGERSGQSVIASASTWDLGAEASDGAPAAFQARVEQELAGVAARRAPGGRVIASSVAPLRDAGQDCLEYDWQAEGPPASGSAGVEFLLRAHGQLCRHPRWPRYAIEVGYVQRHPRNELPAEVAGELRPFLTSLAFSDSRPRFVRTIPVGDYPQGVDGGEGAVWVAYGYTGAFAARIDPRTNEVVARVAVGCDPVGLAVGAGAVWVVNRCEGTVSRIDPATDRVIATVPVGKRPLLVAVEAGAVWVVNGASRDVSRIDPASNQVVATVALGVEPTAVAVAYGSVWVTSYRSSTVSRIDPETNRVVATIRVRGCGPQVIVPGDGAMWVSCQDSKTLERIDPGTNAHAEVVRLGTRPSGLAVVASTVWMTLYDQGTVKRWDLRTSSWIEPPIVVGPRPVLMMPAGDAIWVTNAGGGSVSRIDR